LKLVTATDYLIFILSRLVNIVSACELVRQLLEMLLYKWLEFGGYRCNEVQFVYLGTESNN